LSDAHTAIEGTVATLTRLLDKGPDFGAAIIFSLERHLKAEAATLGEAIEKVHETVLARGPIDDVRDDDDQPKRQQRRVEIFNDVMERFVELQGLVAVLLNALDGDPAEAAVETMRRHAHTDMLAMDSALAKAEETIKLLGGADLETGEART